MSAIEACSHIQISKEDEFHQALKVTLINDNKELEIFDHLFKIYWRNPDKMEKVSEILKKLNKSRLNQVPKELTRDNIEDLYKKADEKLNKKNGGTDKNEQLDVSFYSPNELLKKKRFDSYTSYELDDAKKFIREWKWKLPKRKSRRLKLGRVYYKLDIRNTIRKNIFPFQDFNKLVWKELKLKERPLVVLMDISGSMDQYTRILIHFIHTLFVNGNKIEAFTFGTRLTRVTKYIRYKNINETIENINDLVKDWSGGTKIGESVKKFNLKWRKRVLGGGAIVIMITDGWDTGDIKVLNKEFNLLSKSCFRLIWLNPNLGYENFKPLTEGVRVITKHADKLFPIHNLNCLNDLGFFLSNLNKIKR